MTYTAIINAIPEDAFYDEDGYSVDPTDEMLTLSVHTFDNLDEAGRVTIERLQAARAEVEGGFLGGYIMIGDPEQERPRGWLIQEMKSGSFELDGGEPY